MTADEKKEALEWLETHIGALNYCMRDGIRYVAMPMTREDIAQMELIRECVRRTLVGEKKVMPRCKLAEFAARQECEELTKAIEGFVELRKAKKKPITDRAAGMIIRKLEAISNDPAEQAKVINHCVEMGWTGIYSGDGRAAASVPSEKEESSFDANEFYNIALKATELRAKKTKETVIR